jgi:hypothetical protein
MKLESDIEMKDETIENSNINFSNEINYNLEEKKLIDIGKIRKNKHRYKIKYFY